jgi:hypothetical protein
MTGVYLAGRALQARTWRALALAPVHDWEHAWHPAQAGRVVAAFVLCARPGHCVAWRIYAAASAAYATLRIPGGRSEAYADLTASGLPSLPRRSG